MIEPSNSAHQRPDPTSAPTCAVLSLSAVVSHPPKTCLDNATDTDGGESVFLGGVRDASLRSQLAAFLTALGLGLGGDDAGASASASANADDEGGGQESKGGAESQAPTEFRSRHREGWVMRTVASIMDEYRLADPPTRDPEAAFQAAKQVGAHALVSLGCPSSQGPCAPGKC